MISYPRLITIFAWLSAPLIIIVGIYLLLTIDSFGSFGRERLNPQPQDTPRGLVSLTFDDGWKSVYEEAVPFLDAAGFKGSFYVLTSVWDDERDRNYMRPSQAKALYDAGHEVGSHGVLHDELTKLSETGARSEIERSKSAIESLGIPVSVFSFPLGDYNNAVIGMVKDAGYRGAVTTWREFNTPSDDPYGLKRQQLTNTTTLDEVKGWIDQAIMDDSWLILTFHEIGIDGREYEITREMYLEIIKYIQSTGVRVVTVQSGIDMFLEKK